MTLSGMSLVLLAFLGQGGSAAAGVETVSVTMVAIEAIDEGKPDDPDNRMAGKSFDRRLEEPVKKALAHSLPHDSFQQIAAGKASVALDREAKLTVDDAYTVYVSPLSKERDGTFRVRVRIETQRQDENGPVKTVLSTIIKAVPDDTLILGGPGYGNGDLVVAITVAGGK